MLQLGESVSLQSSGHVTWKEAVCGSVEVSAQQEEKDLGGSLV